MKHTEEEWAQQHWGTDIPWGDRNIVAIDTMHPGRRRLVLPADGADRPLPGDTTGYTAKTRANRGELHCPVPGCVPFDSAVANSRGRHHFRHPRADPATSRPGHDPESREHLAAKSLLAGWLAGQASHYLRLLKVDEYPLTTPNGQVVEPDVYAELTNGRKIAIEYQASPGSTVTLLRKQQAYKQLGVMVWWLYGPGPRTCHVIDAHASQLKANPTSCQKELAQLGGDYFWFDPYRERVGTPLAVSRLFIHPRLDELWSAGSPRTDRRFVRKPLSSKWDKVTLADCALSECELDSETGKLITPATRQILRDERQSKNEIDRLRAAAHRRYLEHSDAESTRAAEWTPTSIAAHDSAPVVGMAPDTTTGDPGTASQLVPVTDEPHASAAPFARSSTPPAAVGGDEYVSLWRRVLAWFT